MSKLEQYLRRYAKTMPDSRARDLMQEAADRIAELEKDLEQSIEHIDNFVERLFCEEDKHTKDCYIGVFLDKHKP
jgi:GTP1/Obg family GTP-binding protein